MSVKQLVEDFGQYIYLSRLKDPQVLLEAIQNGVASMTWADDSFAYAESWDVSRKRYRSLKTGEQVRVTLDAESVVVKPEAAILQLEADELAAQARPGITRRYTTDELENRAELGSRNGASSAKAEGSTNGVSTPVATAKQLRRFHGTVTLDATRLGRDASQIAEAVIQHLAGLVGSEVKLTFEIEADLPDGIPDSVVRTVSENCRTLRFEQFGFEED